MCTATYNSYTPTKRDNNTHLYNRGNYHVYSLQSQGKQSSFTLLR
jgi:stage III sporulation protein SpoIIIAA